MAQLAEVVAFCDVRVRRAEVRDFPGSENGLQFENSGAVTKVGAAVDASLAAFECAAAEGVDFLIVHHGLFWGRSMPVTGTRYAKVKALVDADCAVYGAHLPLDAHTEIGNNAVLARKLGLRVAGWGLAFEGTPIAALVDECPSRDVLRQKLESAFPAPFTAIECGPAQPKRIAILSGSGASAVESLKAAGIDTLITGELKQQHYAVAQEDGLNLYLCGHYATEVFGVQELAREVAERFGVPWVFLPSDCPL